MIKWRNLSFIALLNLLCLSPSYAALKTGTIAPDFKTVASLAGQEMTFSLYEALKNGPVVLYFYPAAFTPGCTVEAHNFAEATEDFAKLGATVIGVSHDSISTLNKFSVQECRNKFAVASDEDGRIMKTYDSVLLSHLDLADRTSYVITPDHKIYYSYSAMNPDAHVNNTRKALEEWRKSNIGR
jgi:peroxiredoxin